MQQVSDIFSKLSTSITKEDNKSVMFKETHCVKSVHIRNFSSPYFPAFGLNTEFQISQYLVRMLENTDQKNSKYGHFSGSDLFSQSLAEWLSVRF